MEINRYENNIKIDFKEEILGYNGFFWFGTVRTAVVNMVMNFLVRLSKNFF